MCVVFVTQSQLLLASCLCLSLCLLFCLSLYVSASLSFPLSLPLPLSLSLTFNLLALSNIQSDRNYFYCCCFSRYFCCCFCCFCLPCLRFRFFFLLSCLLHLAFIHRFCECFGDTRLSPVSTVHTVLVYSAHCPLSVVPLLVPLYIIFFLQIKCTVYCRENSSSLSSAHFSAAASVALSLALAQLRLLLSRNCKRRFRLIRSIRRIHS